MKRSESESSQNSFLNNEEKSGHKHPGISVSLYRIIVTVILVLTWISLGLRMAIDGICLPDQRDRLQVTNNEIATVLAFSSIPAFLGAFVGGILGDIFVEHSLLIISICLTTTAIIITVIRYIVDYTTFFCLSMVMACFLPPIDIIGNAVILKLWGKNSSMPMYAIHLGFGIGATVGPFVATPFLSRQDLTNDTLYTTEQPVTSEPLKYPDGSQIEKSYIILGVVFVFIALMLLLLYLKGPTEALKSETDSENKKKPYKQTCSLSACSNGSNISALFFIITLSTFILFRYGESIAFTNYLFTIATESSLNFSREKASSLCSLYNVCSLLGRAASVIISRWLPIQIMVILGVTFYFVFSVCMAIWGMNHQTYFSTLSYVLGFFGAPLWPGIISWTNEYITVTATVAFMVTVGATIGSLSIPPIFGIMLDKKNYQMIFKISAAFATIKFAQFIIQQIVGYKTGKRSQKKLQEEQDVEEKNVDVSIEEMTVVKHTKM